MYDPSGSNLELTAEEVHSTSTSAPIDPAVSALGVDYPLWRLNRYMHKRYRLWTVNTSERPFDPIYFVYKTVDGTEVTTSDRFDQN